MKNRIVWLDTAKGIGILLVVVGHTMSPVMEGHEVMTAVYSILYVFHMPLFFLLSGMVSGRLLNAGESEKRKLLRQRAKRLMVPYFVWAIIYAPMKLLLKEHVRFAQKDSIWTIFLGNNPAGQLWFLYVLFILSVFTIFFVNQKSLNTWRIGGFIASFLAPIVPSTIGFTGIGLSFSLYQIGFFFLGLSLAQHSDTAFKNGKIAIVCGFVWLIHTAFLAADVRIWYLKMLAAVSACYLICHIAVKLPLSKKSTVLLSYLGRQSVEIYILHAPILVVGRMCLKPFLGDTPWLYVGVLSAGSIVGALVISAICKPKVFRFLVFGE